MARYRLTENKLRNMIREVIIENNLLNNEPDMATVGQSLADLVCNSLRQNNEFVSLMDIIVRAYRGNDSQSLHAMANSFVSGLCNWAASYQSKFYQNRR